MFKDEPRPLTPQMMWIASHPATPWLPADLYQYPTDAVSTTGPKAKKVFKTLYSYSNDFVYEKNNKDEANAFDTQDNMIKHLAGKVKVAND